MVSVPSIGFELILCFNTECLKEKDNEGALPIHVACNNSANLEVIKTLHFFYKEGIDTVDNDGYLPIHDACIPLASLEVIKFIHECSPSSFTKKNKQGTFDLVSLPSPKRSRERKGEK